jgi:hypothetical protein
MLRAEFGHPAAAEECEVALDLRSEQRECPVDTAFAAGREPVEVRPADRAGVGAEVHLILVQ